MNTIKTTIQDMCTLSFPFFFKPNVSKPINNINQTHTIITNQPIQKNKKIVWLIGDPGEPVVFNRKKTHDR